MANEYERIEKVEKILKSIDYYISSPISFIYDYIEDPTTQEIIECTRAIVLKNAETLASKSSKIESLRDSMLDTKAIVATATKTLLPKAEVTLSVSDESAQERKDLSDIIKFIRYSNLDEETKKSLDSLSHQDILRVRLYFYQKILELRKRIKEMIILNPSQDIKKLQNDLDTYEIIIEFIKELELEENEELTIDHERSNVIFAPNNKKSSYFFEDIEEYSDERLKAIKAALDKILDGYIIKTSSTRAIKSVNNLFEYKHPNGIRILYTIIGNNIVILSLFYKDKQRSSKIKSEYEEAITRFKSCELYLINNLNNPDFYIEQAELLGQINTYFENSIDLSKKVGE